MDDDEIEAADPLPHMRRSLGTWVWALVFRVEGLGLSATFAWGETQLEQVY